MTGVRLGEHTTMTRFVVDLTEKVEFRLFTLAAPYRVVIDMPVLDWRLKGAPGNGTSLIKGFRSELFRSDVFRIVLDASRPVRVRRLFFLPPAPGYGHRFVLDLEPSNRATFLAERRGSLEVAALRPLALPESVAAERDKPMVVLDAGHGGIDPGAIGVSGAYEKELTLALARAVRRELEASGKVRVVMTRDRDVFVSLKRRVAIAEAARADLFISFHADAIKDKRVSGGSVYTLSEKASDVLAAELAVSENKADIIAGVDLSDHSPEVTNILIDLARRGAMDVSVEIAKVVVRELKGATRMLPTSRRFAGFAVLKGADVPSLLIELGFMSNRRDERLLRQNDHRIRLARAVTRAVDGWFATKRR